MIEQIHILGLAWSVQFLDELTDFGECDADHRIIKLRNKQTPQQLSETLIHEVQHAIWHMTDIKDKNREETIITRLSVGLASVFCDQRNQAVVDLIGTGTW